ncbi:MAG: peptidyl-tRNA hydrolase [Candidatus Aenigmatarchaeota archaeon]|nr:MAG: peptidyl-tRNA hydrolase [Candidatus Aenigmarchaeota archaeon]
MYKQVIIFRKDLKLGKGKIAAHAAHASLAAVKLVGKKVLEKWENEGAKKIVLKVKDLKELKKVYRNAKKAKLPCVLTRDAGLTQVKKGEIICLAMGPAEEKKIDRITGKLKLL